MPGFYLEFHYLHYILDIATWPAPPPPGMTIRFGPTWYTVDEVACAEANPGYDVPIPCVCTCLPCGLGVLSAVLAGDPDPEQWPEERVRVLDWVIRAGDAGFGPGADMLFWPHNPLLWLEQARLVLRVIRAEDRVTRWVVHPDMRAGFAGRVQTLAQTRMVCAGDYAVMGQAG